MEGSTAGCTKKEGKLLPPGEKLPTLCSRGDHQFVSGNNTLGGRQTPVGITKKKMIVPEKALPKWRHVARLIMANLLALP